MREPRRIGILVFDRVDLLDVGGPYEVFLTASRLAARRGLPPPFEVVTLGRTTRPVAAYGGLRLIPEASVDRAGRLDVLIVPGAIAIDDVLADAELLGAVRGAAGEAAVVASVCTGAFILGELGLLAGRAWTTHWEDVEELGRRIGSRGQVWVRWVDAGEVITSGGLSSGIAMALHLVDRLADRDLAVRTARQLEYDWDPGTASGGRSRR
ncbi:MAG TPA: DJ-1/PfpI family protein [Actinomycetota bacterium]|nr:DJ-1/PfpI family protein [Actinomycetota bacterium]